MVICKKCGTENPLGRVFCGACGAKLDLRDMSSHRVTEAVRRNPMLDHWPKLLWLAAAAVVLLGGLAMWPQTATIGKKGTLVGGQRVNGALRTMADLSPGRSLGRSFSEADINGYFQFLKAKKLGVESVSVRIGEGYFQVRIIRTLGPFAIGAFTLEPRVSTDLTCVPMGAAMRITSASVGHLKVIGPPRASVVRKVYELLSKEPEWKAFASISEIRAQDERLWVNVKKD